MSHKDFVIIADALAKSNAPAEVIKATADTLAASNPRFDAKRFIAAAHGTPTSKRDAVKA